MQQAAFENSFENDEIFSEVDLNEAKGRAKRTLWEVDDSYHGKNALRFSVKGSPLTDMVYECGSSILENSPIPQGLVDFVRSKFLPAFNAVEPEYANIASVVQSVFRYIDWEEPYFFLVDMPVSLSQEDHYIKTYKHKRTKSVLDPEHLEIFKVQRGWKFPHYTYAHKLLTDPRTAAVVSGQYIQHPKENRGMTVFDILSPIIESVFTGWSWFESRVGEWSSIYYDDLKYGARCDGVADRAEIEAEEYTSSLFWYVVVAGVMTWFKSPHGLKYLILSHPVYASVLDWDYEKNIPIIAPGSGGIAIVNGWTIHTLREVEELPGVAAGTCCVLRQSLHCTKRVNVKAVLSNCACGYPRNIFTEDYWEEHTHQHLSCRSWANGNPSEMVFISYGALDNVLNKRPSDYPCQRFNCPKISCQLHAGKQARVMALTKQRTQMLTSARAR